MEKDKKFWSVMSSFKKRSVFSRYMLLCTVTILIPLLILGIVFLTYTFNNLRNDYQDYSDAANTKIAAAFDSVVDTVEKRHYALVSEPDVIEILNATVLQDFFNNYNLITNIDNLYNDIILATPYISSVYIYNENLDYVFGSNQSNYLGLFLDTSWYGEISKNNYLDCIVSRVAVNASISTNCLTFIKNEFYNENYVGSYVYNIFAEKLNDYFNTITDAKTIAIANDDGEILYSTDKQFIRKNLSELLSTHQSSFETVSSSAHNFQVYTCMSDAMYKEQVRSYLIMVSLILILLFLCSIIASFIISKQFYKAILDVIGILQQTETDEYDKHTENEYDFIQRNISKMQSQKASIEEDLAFNLAQLKKSQIKILQEQINPHFISNTLNLISLLDMAEHRTQTKITTIIKNLSELLSAVTDTNEYIVPLKMELEYIKKYMAIQNIKYEDKFKTEIYADQSALNVPVIKFMLQPLVENAINHGILMSETESGTINIAARMYEGSLIITIANSGNIIDDRKLEELNDALAKNRAPQTKHIGLLNVNQRIKLVFGESYGCKLTVSKPAGETIVIITLPVREFNG